MSLAEGGIETGTILVGKYRIEGILGQGGMGLVYRAHHLKLDEPIAIKVLRRVASLDQETVTRFVREAQAAVRLKSEHVARIHDVGTGEDGLPFMVMELLDGADLGQLVDANGAMVPHAAIDLVLQACDAIAEAHSLGIVHRDIKPTNLYVSFRPDQSAIVKVLDFGISKSSGDLSLTQTSSMLGTPAFMSPEQMRSARTVDARTDIWSIGCVLYELLEARQPFIAESFSEMCVMVAMDPPAQMTLAPELEPIVRRCLEKNPDQRYANIAELMRELAMFAGDRDAARRYVTRAHRMLGLPIPANLDAPPALPPVGGYDYTPSPIPVEALRGLHSGPVAVGETIITAPRRSSRRLVIGAVLATLVGVGGSLAYIEATRPDDDPRHAGSASPGADGSDAPDLPANAGSERETDLAGGSGSGAPNDLAAAGSGDAGSAAGSGSAADLTAAGSGSPTGAGSGAALTVRRPPKRPPRAPRPVVKPRPPAGADKVTPATKPPCDPFSSPRPCR